MTHISANWAHRHLTVGPLKTMSSTTSPSRLMLEVRILVLLVPLRNAVARDSSGQTLRGVKFIIYIFKFSRSAPKTQSAREWDLELVSGPDVWCNVHYF